MKEKIKPTIVLTLICVIASVFLVFAYELTKDRIAEQKEKNFNSSVQLLFGDVDSRLLDTTFGADKIEAIAVTDDGRTAVQVIADGYSKDGINILVGIDENGAVSGIEFVSLGETPGLGSKVRDVDGFRTQFVGMSEPSKTVDAISGATFSSNGMKSAVNAALKVYNDNKEAILNG